jgi:hypothetical protein
MSRQINVSSGSQRLPDLTKACSTFAIAAILQIEVDSSILI